MEGAPTLVLGDQKFPRGRKSLQKPSDEESGQAAEGAVKASGGVFMGLVSPVIKCKHYAKVEKKPMKGLKYTKTLLFRNIILVVVWNKLSLWARCYGTEMGFCCPPLPIGKLWKQRFGDKGNRFFI